MKSASCLVGLSLLLAAATAHAQTSPVCPPLPPASGLQWNELAGADYLVCKAVTADGRQVVGVMLTTRDPAMTLARDRRAERARSSRKISTGTSSIWAAATCRVRNRAASPWSNWAEALRAAVDRWRQHRRTRLDAGDGAEHGSAAGQPGAAALTQRVTALRTAAATALQRAGLPGALQTFV